MSRAGLRSVPGNQETNGWMPEMASHTILTTPIFGQHGWCLALMWPLPMF